MTLYKPNMLVLFYFFGRIIFYVIRLAVAGSEQIIK